MAEEEEVQEEQSQLTETQQKAKEHGWDPSFEGDENKRAISAEEFLDRQKLYDDLRKRGKELRQYKEELEALKESHQKIAKQSYERALQDLKKEKKEAYDEGDTDKIVEVDEKIRQTEQERDQEQQTASRQDNTQMQEAFQSWVKENPWYENDPDLREVADAIGNKLQAEDPNIVNDPDEFLGKVVEKVKRASPEKFKGQKRQNPVEAEKGSEGGGKKKYSIKSLDEDTRRVAKRVMDATGMSEQDYMAQFYGETSKGE